MNGKVLLVIHDVYQSDNEFPLGPAYLASVLQQEGVDVKVLCADVFHYSNDQIGQVLRFTHFDMIGLGFLAARFNETVLPLCREINKWKRDAWLVLGGHGPSPIPEYMLETTKADVVAIGEAEETIIDLMICKLHKGNLADVKGIAYRSGDDLVVNERRKPVKVLDSLPFPVWTLFPMEEYTTCMLNPGQNKSERNLAIVSSRGCAHANCSFCYRIEKGLRVRSVENIIEEMQLLKDKYGVTYFTFQDEHFLFSKKRLFDFADALEKSKLKIKFYCQARPDLFDQEIAECLKRIGCQKLNVGFESMDQKVLDAMNKGTTVEQNRCFAELAKEVGLNMGLNFMWGCPWDTEHTLEQNVEFIEKYNTYGELRTIRPLSPYPGTPIYYDAIKSGLLSSPADFFERFKNSDLFTVNFTSIPSQKFYEALFEANRELVIDHYKHTTQNWDEAHKVIQSFYDLYFKGKHDFRGARHYERAKL